MLKELVSKDEFKELVKSRIHYAIFSRPTFFTDQNGRNTQAPDREVFLEITGLPKDEKHILVYSKSYGTAWTQHPEFKEKWDKALEELKADFPKATWGRWFESDE